MGEKNNLENRVKDHIHDGPFGPVEFQAYLEGEETYELFISHLKVHERYRRRGIGRKAVRDAVEMCVESNVPVERVSIDILDEGGAEEFLRELGFQNIKFHDDQVSGWQNIEKLRKEEY